ncbi:MAG: Smr/MutS family protein [Anaerolineales bacterium]
MRGKLADEDLDELEKYLERAYSAGLLFVRIVHGKGTGKMRDAVRNALKSSEYVSSFEEPKDNEWRRGCDGCEDGEEYTCHCDGRCTSARSNLRC